MYAITDVLLTRRSYYCGTVGTVVSLQGALIMLALIIEKKIRHCEFRCILSCWIIDFTIEKLLFICYILSFLRLFLYLSSSITNKKKYYSSQECIYGGGEAEEASLPRNFRKMF